VAIPSVPPNDAVIVSLGDASRIVPEELPDSVKVIEPVKVPAGPSVKVTVIPVESVVDVSVASIVPAPLELASVTVIVAVSISLYCV